MASTTDKLLKKIAGLWKQAEKLQKQWAAESKAKPPKRKAKSKAKPKAKRRRSSR